MTPRVVMCDVCGAQAGYENNKIVYGGSLGKHPYIWYCYQCEAYVGVHDGTNLPLGKLASEDTRQSRRAAHQLFDQLWKGENKRFQFRGDAYEWLAGVLGIPRSECHIGQMDSEQCTAVMNAVLDFMMTKE